MHICGLLQSGAAAETLISTFTEEPVTQQRALLRATPVFGGDLAAPTSSPVEITIEAPGEARIPLDQELAWRIDLETDGYWCAPGILAPHQPSAMFKLVPTGIVESRLQIPENGTVEALRVRFQSAVASAKATEPPMSGEISCPVEHGTWSCSIPVGDLDIRIRAEGYISHYFWNVTVSKERSSDLGFLHLKRGSSVSGWVAAEDGLPLSPDSRVELVPMIATGSDPSLKTRVQLHLLAKSVEKGFFHFEGVAPGSFIVSVEQRGYLSERVSPVVVTEDAETEIADTILLYRPLDLEVNILPEQDLSENTWKLLLLAMDSMETSASGSANEAGLWVARGLRPGNYLLFLSDSQGTRMAVEHVPLDDRRTSYSIELPIVWVEGEVTLGAEPLPASLVFGGVSSSVSIKMDCDLEGRFIGWVPRPGLWNIDVMSDDPEIFRRLTNVEVEPRQGSEVAWLDISLPDTILEGSVLDEGGNPVPQANVLILRLPAAEPPSYTSADDQGEFSVHGYPPGEYRLEARAQGEHGPLSSEPTAVVLAADAPTASVRLIMREMTEVRGRVVSSTSSGVPGASIRLSSIRGEGLPGIISPSTQSDMEGRFVLEVPREIRHADLTVLAPGWVLSRSPVTIEAHGELVVPLSQDGGTLIVNLNDTADFTDLDQPRIFVIHNSGVRFDLGTLASWATMNGVVAEDKRIIVPNMPLGAYSVCWPRRNQDTRSSTSMPRCMDGFLLPSGELEIQHPRGDQEGTTRPNQ
jgi:hypothetical protein